MLCLSQALSRIPEFNQMMSRIAQGGAPVAMGGLSHAHKAHIAAAVRRLTGRPVYFICADEIRARTLAADMSALAGENAPLLPAREFNFYHAESVSRGWEHDRLSQLYRIGAGEQPFGVITVEALMQRTMPKQILLQIAMELGPGMEVSPQFLSSHLTEIGYKRCTQVEGAGQFSLRGGILDIYSPSAGRPVRMEFFGDEIDTMAYIDTDTQRRVENAGRFVVLPAAETLPGCAPGGIEALEKQLKALRDSCRGKRGAAPALMQTLTRDIEELGTLRLFPAIDRYMPYIYPGMATAVDYLPRDAVLLIDEHARVRERIKNLLWQHGQDIESMLASGIITPSAAAFYLDAGQLGGAMAGFDTVMLDSFISAEYDIPPRAIYSITAKQLPSYSGSFEAAEADIRHYIEGGYSTVVFCGNERRARHLSRILEDRGIYPAMDFELEKLPIPGTVSLAVGSVSAGMEYPSIKLAVITEGQMMAPRKAPKKKSGDKSARERLESYADLSPGDLVVHEYHGIGRFAGIEKMKIDGVERDYIKISFAGTDSLFVPVTQLDLVSKYIGAGEDAQVRLHKLGGAEWQKAKTRARAATRDLAEQLIALYAQRKRLRGFAFPADSEWQLEFEEAFEYEETDDQLTSAAEIKADMEQEFPMDRLLCGDVGFGKTEVALRAVMKCILGGKQAAIMVPTTVLARQHYITAQRRFAGYPVRVEMLSRFRSPAQIKSALKKLAAGEVDFVIGTHRLLQKDVKFKDLGLLIVDEEQRFGVTHKERLKEMAKQVDVLTLTATPIPRTLNMALSGIRDMSTIDDPPRDRHPVQTYVLEHDWSIVADAIRREVSRGGQVYYLHNRVETIDRTASRLSRLLDNVNIGVAHGQMEEKQLGEVMTQMSEGEIQVLVCTTIIETGIDIPNVNTLIIEDADRLGLAQLHQIRGRVGRSQRHAYAYLTFRRGKVLSEVASKRLSAIREYAEFGSGFKIAMRDLEIRGAGNVLGPEQHGFMMSVGYDMYLKLLEEAVIEGSKDTQSLKNTECSADFAISAGIPDSYIPSAEQRMDIYRRIARAKDDEDASDLIDELVDRFGDPPESVDVLLRIALLRAKAGSAGISEIVQKGGSIRFGFCRVDVARVSALCARPEYKRKLLFNAGEKPYLLLRLDPKDNILASAHKVAEAYGALEEIQD